MDNYHRNSKQIKDVWFDYLLSNRKHWCNGFTKVRLEKIRKAVLEDNYILQDLFVRHGAAGMFPEEHKQENKEMFEHGFSNFCAAILDKMIEANIYKVR